MVEIVPAEDIERIVGIQRHETEHWARAVTEEQQVYILHSVECLASGIDLRECSMSEALSLFGIEPDDWPENVPVRVSLDEWGQLLPMAHAQALVVVETFEIKGRGTAYTVEAGDPPFMAGDNVLLYGVEHVVTSVEMQPTAVPRYVINGKQSLLLRQL